MRLALALAGNPDFLILDEPTAGMDALARRAFWETMRAEAAEGRTLLFATHYLTEARKALVKVSADGKKPGAVISDTGAAVFGVAGAVVVLAAAGIALTIWRKRRI